MGNYEVQKLSPNQLESVVELTSFLQKSFMLILNEIKGHKDYTSTLCPGADFYRLISDGTIQRSCCSGFGRTGNKL
jgi:hypothetical protein